jgi:hypothetical protein
MTHTKHEFFQCSCRANDHLFTVSYEDDYPWEMWISCQLNIYKPWYERLWLGLKYILGMSTCAYGHWDCTILASADVYRLFALTREVLNAQELEQLDLDRILAEKL